ncbi:MAG: GlxA family transcriptional regulator [Alphaproteobacteria bacterium]|nr:GlxA family transcriptional regulator [Alphaproteobacteria bacterium]
MFQSKPASQNSAVTERIAFFLVPKFSMIAFTAALEALRLANRLSGKALYAWHVISRDGQPVEASNGLQLMAEHGIDALERFPTVILCSGIDAHLYRDDTVFARFRRLARQHTEIGALCTGSHILARAGLLGGYRCTIHWENLGSFTEEFPDIEVSSELFEVDRDRFTCAGGIAAADLMLHAIASRHGQELAAAVSEQFILDRIRDPHDPQRVPLRARIGIGHPKLIEVVSHMEANQEEPLAYEELARRVGLSRRQLERLFRRYLKTTPGHYYLKLRLTRARLLLMQTTMPVIDVALASGFVSASHFSKCYRDFHGRTPREERRLLEAALGTEPESRGQLKLEISGAGSR